MGLANSVTMVVVAAVVVAVVVVVVVVVVEVEVVVGGYGLRGELWVGVRAVPLGVWVWVRV